MNAAALRVDGVDLSRYQTYKINWDTAKAEGLKWVYHKITEGNSMVWQAQYDKRRAEAAAAGVPFGAYHFARAQKPLKSDGISEAKHFLLKAQIKPGDLQPVLDIETTEGLTNEQLRAWTEGFIEECRRQGFNPIVYTNFDLGSATNGCLIWRARYNNANKSPLLGGWDIWQFSNGVHGTPKRFAGFPGPTDLNVMRDGLTVEQMIYKPKKGGAVAPSASKDKMDPAAYFIGARGQHVTWLGRRLVKHLEALGLPAPYKVGPGPEFTATDRKAVKAFQKAQGWTGADADGFPGQETLRRLSAAPGKLPATPVPPSPTTPVAAKLKIRATTANIQNFNPNLPPAKVKADMAKVKPLSDLVLWQELAEDRDFTALIKVMGNKEWGNTAHGNECLVSWKREWGTIKLSENVPIAKSAGKFSPKRALKRLVLDTAIGEVEVICVHYTNGARQDPKRKPYWDDCWEGTKKVVDAALAAGRVVIVGGDFNWPTNKVPKFIKGMVWVAGGDNGIDGIAVCLPSDGFTLKTKGKTVNTGLNSDHDARTREIVLSRLS